MMIDQKRSVSQLVELAKLVRMVSVRRSCSTSTVDVGVFFPLPSTPLHPTQRSPSTPLPLPCVSVPAEIVEYWRGESCVFGNIEELNAGVCLFSDSCPVHSARTRMNSGCSCIRARGHASMCTYTQALHPHHSAWYCVCALREGRESELEGRMWRK